MSSNNSTRTYRTRMDLVIELALSLSQSLSQSLEACTFKYEVFSIFFASLIVSLNETYWHLGKECSHSHHAPYVCSIVPPRLLQEILNRDETSSGCKVAAQKTLNHISRLQSVRQSRTTFSHASAPHTDEAPTTQSAGKSSGDDEAPAPHSRAPPRRSIIPPKIFQAMAESEDTTSDQKQ